MCKLHVQPIYLVDGCVNSSEKRKLRDLYKKDGCMMLVAPVYYLDSIRQCGPVAEGVRRRT